ncbi:lysozyme inhibitor LprI family protein [Methylicorpusculum sp.]|uniref:lysozyme inhibitor LprI family protein n=1 Tax=Methylicorpusculum sp. TaxID=2713644 RepID=UPI00271A2D37|nr:lysozyme inhibitor LprI family protein [Methylicorpusculum sp.]MDO8845589.1 hypothetical protein [Methylicorpusculum sp.]
MNKIKTLFILFVLFSLNTSVFCQTSQKYMEMADKAFDTGEKDKAKELYLKAAEMNNADAHFSIAYKFVVSKEERISHFSAAAKMGHAKALEQVFDALFFRANSLTAAKPELAIEIYNLAKSYNPSLTFFNEEDKVSTIKKCIEAGNFDAKTFIEKYGIEENELNEYDYSIWELAAEASRSGRFGSPNPKVVLQLVCRGGSVPMELGHAVEAAYINWKENKVFEFNVCDYVGSGSGLSYCSEKAEQEANKEYLLRINELSSKLKNNAGKLLMNSFSVVSRFIEEKAWKEELHGGSGYAAWTRDSIMQQKTDYLDLIETINNDFRPDKLTQRNDSDRILNKTYQTVINRLKKKPITTFNASIDEEGVRSVQRLWIQYRDTTAKLFAQIVPSINENIWKNWLTEIRTKELKQILNLDK